jgi:spermidine synthase
VTRAVAIALTTVTGFTGLVYEVTWQKYLATLLGSHAEATAAVLAIFLGGLSFGYAIFGEVTRRLVARARARGGSTRLLLLYAAVEAGIGVYALVFPILFGFAQSASLLVPTGNAALGFGFDVALATILIGPPAILMGGTIPILTLALAADRDRASRIHALIYGFNTAGAFLGALAGGFWLIPKWGLDGVLIAMGTVNVVVGLAFAALGRFGEAVEPSLVDPGKEQTVQRFWVFASVSLLAGFSMMALQTTLNRVAGLAFGSSHFTFAVVVAIFVLCIALGSLAVSMLRRISPLMIVASQWSVVAYLYWLYGQMENAPYWAFTVRALFRSIDLAFYPFQAVSALGLFAVLVIPIGLSGALLPMLFHHLRGEVGELGAVAGRLYSWNTIGSLLGALLGGYILLFWVDLDDVYRVALGGAVVAAGLLTVLLFRVSALAVGVLVVLPAWAGLALLPDWNPERITFGLFRNREPQAPSLRGPDAFFVPSKRPIIFHVDDPVATISVREGQRIEGRLNRNIITNGKSDGNLVADYQTMAMLALVPALLAERTESCFVIGYGTGVTAGELAALDSVQSVEVAEISHAVLEAAPLFDEGSLNASTSPKVSKVRSDAYRTLRRTDQQFDVIVSEPSNPWVTGVEMLYSVEFLEAARSRLAPGGVFAQWFHLYETDRKTVDVVLRTFASVFPHVSVWYSMQADLLLLGFNDAEHALDILSLRQRFFRRDFQAGFERAKIDNIAALLAHEVLPLGMLNSETFEGPSHTLRHPILSDRAARAFFLGRVARLPKITDPVSSAIGFENSLLRRHGARPDGSLPERILAAAAHELCQTWGQGCPTMLAKLRGDYGKEGRFEPLTARLRKARPNKDFLAPAVIDPLQRLFGGTELAKFGPGRSLMRATRMTSDFIQHYHPAVPFDRSMLEAAWDACIGSGCDQARRRAEERLSSIDDGAGGVIGGGFP